MTHYLLTGLVIIVLVAGTDAVLSYRAKKPRSFDTEGLVYAILLWPLFVVILIWTAFENRKTDG